MAGGLGWAALVGGIVLAVVLLYAVLMNGRRTKADRRRTEEATRTLYDRIDREDKVSDPDRNSF